MVEGEDEVEHEALIPGALGFASQRAAGRVKLLSWRAGVNRVGTECAQAPGWPSALSTVLHACCLTRGQGVKGGAQGENGHGCGDQDLTLTMAL